jgi:hypothetical protein
MHALAACRSCSHLVDRPIAGWTLAALQTATALVCLDAVTCDDAGWPDQPIEAHPTYVPRGVTAGCRAPDCPAAWKV